MKKVGRVIIPIGMKPQPADHEKGVAKILADHYGCDIIFLEPRKGYKMKTPDIVMVGKEWEIKSPTGSSPQSIEQQFRKAKRQSRSIIIDTSRSHLDDKTMLQKVISEVRRRRRIKQVILVDKKDKVLEINEPYSYNKK